jgi:hypothetical protein
MQVKADLSTDNTAASLLQKRADGPTGTNQPAAARDVASTGSSIDLLLPRLTETPSPIQDGDFDVQDGSQATKIMGSLIQSMNLQPGMAMTAHANQSPGNVLSLLQATD